MNLPSPEAGNEYISVTTNPARGSFILIIYGQRGTQLLHFYNSAEQLLKEGSVNNESINLSDLPGAVKSIKQ